MDKRGELINMDAEKRKRIFIESVHFAQAIKIGEIGEEPAEVALNGIIKALKHYEDTSHVDLGLYKKIEMLESIDPSVINNIEAMLVLSKNSSLTKDEICSKINNGLKSAIAEILES